MGVQKPRRLNRCFFVGLVGAASINARLWETSAGKGMPIISRVQVFSLPLLATAFTMFRLENIDLDLRQCRKRGPKCYGFKTPLDWTARDWTVQ
jgi:hypothetical protein